MTAALITLAALTVAALLLHRYIPPTAMKPVAILILALGTVAGIVPAAQQGLINVDITIGWPTNTARGP